jgi:hypothetical protein
VSRKLTLDTIQKFALDRGGECLSESYLRSDTHLTWKCHLGHIWTASWDNIKQEKWCPVCGGTKKLTIEVAKNLAGSKQGACLSSTYENIFQPLLWLCSEGHFWQAPLINIRHRGDWCPICAGNNYSYTIKEMQDLAISRGGLCLSNQYESVFSPLLWRCAKGHEWEATPTSLISSKSWCPHCAGCFRGNLEECQKLAKEKGGACLSNNYTNNRTKLQWVCRSGHIWEASFNHIKFGSWCPYCLDHSGEESCRSWLEAYFSKPFPKVRPKWLLSPIGHTMELDGYNVELKLAFEYQGGQHFNKNHWFYKNEDEFNNRIKRDMMKVNICKEQGITLLVVPYTKLYSLDSYLRFSLKNYVL